MFVHVNCNSLIVDSLSILQWKKHWFVLTDQTLRFYRDAVAEEVWMDSYFNFNVVPMDPTFLGSLVL